MIHVIDEHPLCFYFNENAINQSKFILFEFQKRNTLNRPQFKKIKFEYEIENRKLNTKTLPVPDLHF